MLSSVAPLVGVWIEIKRIRCRRSGNRSLPSWECGLKYTVGCHVG